MARLRLKLLICLVWFGASWPLGPAQAEEVPPTSEPAPDASEPAPDASEPAGPEKASKQQPASDAVELGGVPLDVDLNDDAIYLDPALSGDNVIIVWGNRIEKPYQRDTALRITGQELKKRGINNLGEALEQLPELFVRPAGRGGTQIDIRGARKGSVKILLDGIAVSDPYYGNIDLSAIPVTDIEQIRVSTSTASPIDGTGGPGGVIEILTTDAIGPGSVRARLSANSLPSANVSATGRAMLTEHLAARLSVSVLAGAEEFELRPDGAADSTFIGEDRQQSVAAVRLEYRKGVRRLVADIWTQQVNMLEPPAEDLSMNILSIDGESQGRLGVAYDDKRGGFLLQSHAYYHLLSRQSTYYEDADLSVMGQSEDLRASRSGLSLLANRSYGKQWQFVASSNLESEQAEVDGFDNQLTEGRVTLVQSALAAQFNEGPLDLQASGGVAVPLGIGADPWLEYKVVTEYAPIKAAVLTVTSGYKGRTPTLRERYRLDVGNASLGPEKVLFGEVRLALSPHPKMRLGVASYVRRTNGLIRFDFDRAALINSEELVVRGIESSIEASPRPWLSGGGSWSFGDAESEALGQDPLDFFPAHRLSSWLRLGFDRAGTTARLQYIGPQIDKNTELDSRLLLQLSAYARIGGNLLFTLRGENLSGTRYEQRLGVRAPGRVVFASLQTEWK